MKKFTAFMVTLFTIPGLSACSLPESSGKLSEAVVAPYELSDKEKDLLEAFGMADNSHIISFRAPKETTVLYANVYRLGDDSSWERIGGTDITGLVDLEDVKELAGTVTMQLREDYKIDMNISCAGRVSFTSDPVALQQEVVGSMKGFLQEPCSIELNEEIPVAVMVYDSGNHMSSYSVQDYFEPSKFEGMDLVQAVTLKFSDQE